jgi:hypothetical protein
MQQEARTRAGFVRECWPRKIYRIIKHDGVEYLFDEQGNAVKKFEETKDERELRHGWRREEG